MQGASIFHFARGLHRREFFTTREMFGAVWKQAYFRVAGVEDPEHVAEARNSALGFIAGHTVRELQDLGEEIFDEAMAHRIWPGTRALAQLHLDRGQRVWLVTAAPIEIAAIIARRLGRTGAMGTVAEHVDGVYTGRLVGTCCTGPPRRKPSRHSRPARGSTLPPARRTPTPPTTCRCWRSSATPVPSTLTPGCAPRPRPGVADPRLPHRPQGGARRSPLGVATAPPAARWQLDSRCFAVAAESASHQLAISSGGRPARPP